MRVLWVTPTVGPRFGGPTSTITNGLIAENRAGIESELATTIGRSERESSIPALRRLAESGVSVRVFRRTALTSRGEAWGLSISLA
ncbi:MAG: hypothetical protein M3Y45_04790, partial [Actinomycetota bacterium]|nr:hypothetical protein [Actinomycetota bacterium]